MRQMGNNRSIGVIIGLLVVVALAVFAFRGCNPGGGIPGTGGAGGDPSGEQGQLGRAFVASQVSQDGCPQRTANQFNSSDTIYVGLTESDIPQGTSIFARLLRDGDVLEDTNEITADRDMRTCIWFQFQPSRSANGFEPGDYTAQLFVNGNPADEVAFTVEGGAFSSSGPAGAAGAELGRLYTSTRVDSNGCPTDSVRDFRPDEAVYVAYDRSFIPAGSQMFARLLLEGDTIEDSDVITAERDINACVWFVFESERGAGGLEPGSYEAQIYLNGDLVDQANFEVR